MYSIHVLYDCISLGKEHGLFFASLVSFAVLVQAAADSIVAASESSCSANAVAAKVGYIYAIHVWLYFDTETVVLPPVLLLVNSFFFRRQRMRLRRQQSLPAPQTP